MFESFVPVRDAQQSFAFLSGRILEKAVFDSIPACQRFLHRLLRHRTGCDNKSKGDVSSYMSFFDWVSLAWYHVVGTGNTDHFLAGCSVEKLRSWGGVASYCAKYMSKADSENFMSDIPTGR